MAEDEDKVENLKPGKSLIETSFNRLFEQRKKDKKAEIDKQTKLTADAYDVFRNALTKLKELEAEHNALEDDKITLTDLGIA